MIGLFIRILAFASGIFCVVYYYTDGDYSALLNRSIPLASLVRDEYGYMSEDEEKQLRQYHTALASHFDIDYRIVLVGGAVDADADADRAIRERRVGNRSETGRGVLLYIAPDSNRVRFRATFSDPSIFPDSFVAYVQNRQLSRDLRKRMISKAVLEASALIYQRVQEASQGEIFDPRRQEMLARGLDPDAVREEREEKVVTKYGAPMDVLRAYVHAMRTRDGDPNLRFYSKATKEMLAGQEKTPQDMLAVLKTVRECPSPEVKILHDEVHAVLRYPVYERTCAPWFLVAEDGEWRLDLTMERSTMRKDNLGEWYFLLGVHHDYEAAFADWLFNGDGYPLEP